LTAQVARLQSASPGAYFRLGAAAAPDAAASAILRHADSNAGFVDSLGRKLGFAT